MIDKQDRFRNTLLAAILVILSVSTLLMLPSTFKANATSSAPIFGGWGGTMLKDTNSNSTAPQSSAYPNETQSNFEQELLKQIAYGYNAIRVSFAPFCGLKYHLSYGGGLETNFMGDFSGSQLRRAIHIAQYYNSYLAVDYHGYSDFYNSTTINCVANFWTQNITIPYRNGYANLIWEILNEPNLPGLNDQQATTATSTGYQTVLNAIRSNGDTHWVAVGNVCSYGCGKTVDQYYLDYPNVNDTATQRVFEDLHTYIGYNNTAYGTGYCGTVNNLPACSTLWTNATADKVARSYYLDFLNQSAFTSQPAWPNISLEGGTVCGTATVGFQQCPYVGNGHNSDYSTVSFHFIQSLINLEDNASPRIGRFLWMADAWDCAPAGSPCYFYGGLTPGNYGTFLSYKGFATQNKATLVNADTQPFGYPWDGSGFYAQGRHWLLYINYTNGCEGSNQNCLYYASSLDTIHWTTNNLGLVTSETPSVVTNGTHVFYVRYDGTGATLGKALMFRVGALNTNGTVTWQAETTIKPATSGQEWYGSSLRISTTGQAFVAYTNVTSDAGDGFPWAIHSNGIDFSHWQQETLLRTVKDQWRFSLVALPNGQMYALYWPWSGALRGRLYSNGAWGNVEVATPSGTQVFNNAFGFSTGNNVVYAIWQELNTQKLQFASRSTLGTWNSPSTIATADTASNPRWTASYDPLRTKWYLTYDNYTLNQIYQYSGTPGNWTPKTQLYSTSGGASDMVIGSDYNTTPISSSIYQLGIFWIQRNPSSNYNLEFANEIIT